MAAQIKSIVDNEEAPHGLTFSDQDGGITTMYDFEGNKVEHNDEITDDEYEYALEQELDDDHDMKEDDYDGGDIPGENLGVNNKADVPDENLSSGDDSDSQDDHRRRCRTEDSSKDRTMLSGDFDYTQANSFAKDSDTDDGGKSNDNSDDDWAPDKGDIAISFQVIDQYQEMQSGGLNQVFF